MTSLFLFLTITGMIHSSHICQRDHIQKKIKSPYPPYKAPPNLAPWCLSNLSTLPMLPTFQPPWPLCISGTFSHAHIGPQIFPRFHLSFNLYLFVQKLLLWEASPVTPFRIATSVIFYPSNPLNFFSKVLISSWHWHCITYLFDGVFFPLEWELHEGKNCVLLCYISGQEHNLCIS